MAGAAGVGKKTKAARVTGEFTLALTADREMLEDFVAESREYIADAEAGLLALEAAPDDTAALNAVFRAFHTIKGTAAFLDLPVVAQLAHRAESLLSRIRDGETPYTARCADLALQSIDTMKELIRAVEDGLKGSPMLRPTGLEELMARLEADGADGLGPTAEPAGAAPVHTHADGQEFERAVGRMTGNRRESAVRVRTERLDRLIDVVGELVIAHSMVAEDRAALSSASPQLSRKVSQVGRLVRELHDLGISLRMVPLGPTLQKMARLVRDLALKSGKTIELVTEGEDVEIDRNMVDVLDDVLVHLVRNAIDHGIEPPDVRELSGKPPKGIVRVDARHVGGSLVVTVRDDGRGLEREKIAEHARRFAGADKPLPERQAVDVIFQPGFSTAEQVSDVSGRGVGLDVVKKGVEALKGRIDIWSEPGQGCVFSLRLPLTLALIDGMLLRVGNQRYLFPSVDILMSFCPDAGAISTLAERGEMVMFQGELIPLLRLHRLFDITEAIEDPTGGVLVVVDDGERHYGLLADELLGQQQVVTKSISDGMPRVPGISGGAILGDGRVGLILDASGLALLARRGVAEKDSKQGRL